MSLAEALFGGSVSIEDIQRHNDKVAEGKRRKQQGAAMAQTKVKTNKKTPVRKKRSQRKVYVPLEHDEQVEFVNWLKEEGIFYFAVPNENSLSSLNRNTAIKVGSKMKAGGVIKGASDLMIFTPKKMLAIEMKRSVPSLSKISPEQQLFTDLIGSFKYCDSFICYGSEAAKKVVLSYLN